MSADALTLRQRWATLRSRPQSGWSPRLRSTLMILGGSTAAALPLLADAPILPPFGFLAFVIWRLLAPALLPPWYAIGFATFDDLVSGNPLGTGILLWTVVALVLEGVERAFLFRNWRQDWMIANLTSILYLGAMWLLFPINGGSPPSPTALLLPAVLSLIAIPPLIRLATGPGEPDPRRG